ncbi:(deoxy)nucleoside triphosphate pyrophosphohydrolase [Streptomyces sp. S465]|uniref:(deoxy)nucleoside triphosphate pyrophosphohydrolase n=1 Tax=Streptomyces sp. S465 TaxID=2979468 RepID=UPI0022A87ED6|nr:(deoxy)nucleoside triphosphate pyrophosphohydrolase [Streptomyces sp. S465]WAP58083.1 (deoxy)nucleoside triphosphate pyrophosphohydrolase [Streptomyces sp. S465]
MSVRVVVGGAVFDRGRLLAARRSAPPDLAGRWELPGGKAEPGETPQQTLVRELREELGVEVEPLEPLPGEWALKPGYVLRVWTAALRAGEPHPLEDHDELRWLPPDRVDEVDWLDEDRPAVAEAVRRLRAGGAEAVGGTAAAQATGGTGAGEAAGGGGDAGPRTP